MIKYIGFDMARRSVIICRECGARAKIKSTKYDKSVPDLSTLYCRCCNPTCNHEFVMNLEYSHTTRSSDATFGQIIGELLKRLSNTDQQKILSALK